MLLWEQVNWIPSPLLPLAVGILGVVGLVRATESVLGGVRRCLDHLDALQDRFRKRKKR